MKKVVIIGANSYIARNVTLLLEQCYPETNVMLYDYAEIQIDNRANYRQISILDEDSVKNIDFDCDIVFMFVGKTGSANGFDEFGAFIDINEKALLNILNEYRRQGSKAKIIFPSTRLVYKGKAGALKEDAEKEFKTIYAINKFACENYLEQYNNVFGVQYCIFRICIPYGTLIPNASSYGTAEFMLKKATNGENISLYGDGSVRRTLTYMGDLCNALIEGAFSDKCKNDVFNIGGEDYSLKEMAELISVKYGVGIDYVDWPEVALKIESGDTVFDDTKLKAACNIAYEMKFEDWCKEN
ncbi:MAG: NAD(P)-dependent oxidoreductase [Oscillospiraceae bacterium]|nr:NAD(P)-dependent oxidoreductase [Oscillospiraceae bacterium]